MGGVASGVRHVNSVSRSAAGALVGARVGESSSGGDRESLEAWPTSECSGVLVVADREVTVGAAAAVRPCPVAVSAGVASPVWLVAKEVVQATPVGWPTPRLRIISVKLKRRVVLWGRNFSGRERELRWEAHQAEFELQVGPSQLPRLADLRWSQEPQSTFPKEQRAADGGGAYKAEGQWGMVSRPNAICGKAGGGVHDHKRRHFSRSEEGNHKSVAARPHVWAWWGSWAGGLIQGQ